MSIAITLMGTFVALQYLVIGLYVVPRLARLAEYRGGVIRLAQWGAAAFFIGCGLTHTGVAIHSVTEPLQGSDTHLLLAHVGPHIAQIVGGETFIAIAARKLDVRFAAKDDASGERTRALLASLVEDSDDAIVAIDTRRRVTAWNHGAERLYGFAAAEMVGRPIGDTVPADHAAEHEALIRRVFRHGEGARLEGERLRRNGSDVPVALSVSPMRGATGTVIGASAIVHDISARRHDERQRQKLLARLEEAEERFAPPSSRRPSAWDWSPCDRRAPAASCRSTPPCTRCWDTARSR